jgi:hypothetical protein
MSKTSHTSNGALEDHSTLADSELDAVTGAFPPSFLATVDGHTEVSWTPRAYAVQTDLSGRVTVRALACMNGEDDEQDHHAQFRSQPRIPRS